MKKLKLTHRYDNPAITIPMAHGKKWPNMSDRKVRIEERLRIKIGEAKNLPPRNNHGTVGQRDVYCVLSLDREEIFRTMTVERSLSPFFGEEFQFDVPRTFRFLSLYVYDRDRPMKQDKVIGKVAIKKEDLHQYDGKDHWFNLRPVDADSEVQGKAHIEVKMETYLKSGSNDGSPHHRIIVRVIDCSDLTVVNGACDPYATVTFWYSTTKQECKRTKVKKKTTSPSFDEVFAFELPTKGQNHDRENIYHVHDTKLGLVEARVALWHDSPGMFGNVFLGEVRIPFTGIDLTKGHNAWYLLQPREVTKLSRPELGSVRLKIHYTLDNVFSSHFYDALRELLLVSPSVEPITSSAAYILGEIVSNKVDAVQPLARIFLHHKQIVPLIKALAKWEISKVTDTNTIFRGNTLASKMMDEFMKLVGLHYLRSTLRPVLEQILREKKSCEVDPSRLKDRESLEANSGTLVEYLDKTLSAITNSALNCPRLMCQTFHALKELSSIYFPETREVRYSVISGFIFLRFFAPAILGPKLFDLTTEQIDSQTYRTLTLISKTIQSLGNLVSSRSSHQIFKEEYMGTVHGDFFTPARIQAVRDFLEIISSTSTPGHEVLDTPVLLKEGMMIKRAQGRKRFGIKNFKRRYFRLTTQDLSYSKNKGDPSLCKIPLDQILAVERVQEDSFKMNNMFQVVQPQRTLYIQANNCVEGKEWMDMLTKICEANANRLRQYHPGAYINGHWLCCKATYESAPGCCEVSVRVEANLCLHIDSDREMERIYSLFVRHMSQLQRLIDTCECQAVYMGEHVNSGPGSFIEDTQSCFKTLTAIQACVQNLEKEHRNHMRILAKETEYGSKQAPIGDDNYLLLAARAGKVDARKTFSNPN